MKLLVVGDPHAHPDYDNSRFTALGRFVADQRPDVLLVMGDWGDFPSLCRHSRKIEVEGKRVRLDKRAAHESLALLESQMDLANSRRRASRQRQFPTRKIYLLGNHEARLDELVADNPQLEGELASYTEPFSRAGWLVYPFKEIVTVGGFAVSHFLPSGNTGRPIGGANLARTLLTKGHQSCLVGHDHRLDYAKDERWDGTKIHAFSTGCFAHPEYNEGWCKQTEPMWDRGVLVLDGVEDGSFKRKLWVTQQDLLERYG